MEDLINLTKQVWTTYLGRDRAKVIELLNIMDDNVTVIGTGKQEIYKNLKEFEIGLTNELNERDGISFELKNYKCTQQKLMDDVYILYGEALIWWEAEDKSICINLDSRFTIIYKKLDGKWKIVHLHQSVPNIEQMGGEAYPKTMMKQVEKANQEINELSDLASRDALTGLYNQRFLYNYCQETDKSKSWIYMVDIDDFKRINDVYGHPIGDEAICKTADILNKEVAGKGIACRIGGDEFLLLCNDFESDDEADTFVEELFKRFREEKWEKYKFTGISVGYGLMNESDSLEDTMERVDKAF